MPDSEPASILSRFAVSDFVGGSLAFLGVPEQKNWSVAISVPDRQHPRQIHVGALTRRVLFRTAPAASLRSSITLDYYQASSNRGAEQIINQTGCLYTEQNLNPRFGRSTLS